MTAPAPDSSTPHERAMATPIKRTDPAAQEVLDVMSRIANGDLTARVPLSHASDGLDELRSGLNRIADSFAKEIEARRQAELELRTSERRYYTLFHESPIAITVTSTEGDKYDLVNQAFLDMFGYTMEEAEHLRVSDIYTDMSQRESIKAEAAEKGAFRDYEIALRRKDGSEIHCLVTTIARPGADGSVTGYHGVIRDITALTRSQEALQESESIANRLAAENEGMAEIGRIMSSSFDIDTVYEQFAGKLKGMLPFDMVSINMVDPKNNTFSRVYRSGLAVPGRSRVHRSSKNTVSAEVIRTRGPVVIPDAAAGDWQSRFPNLQRQVDSGIRSIMVIPLMFEGKVLGAVNLSSLTPNTYSDAEAILAERVASQIAGSIANAQLYTAVAEAEKQLEQRAEELARSNSELEMFAYVASHDLQEPLRMVSSYVQLLANRYQDRLDDDANDFIHYAVDGAERMEALINDLLAYSRVGTQTEPFESTDCSAVVEEVVANLRVAIGECGAAVTRDEMPTLMADHGQLVQVFQNLIGNALKFRGDRSPEVHVGARRAKDEWEFWVADNGIGITPKHYERIFAIFQRLHSRSEYDGTGVGLAICKKIVERHGGRMWVESQVGEGSSFHLTIPASLPVTGPAVTPPAG